MFILISSMVSFAQPKLDVPFEMKKGESAEIGGLKIKYLGGDREWATGMTREGKHFEIHYLRYRFEVTGNGKTEKIQIVSPVKVGELVLQVAGPQRVEEHQTDEICRLVVMTAAQFDVRQKQAEIELADIGKLLQIDYFAVEPVGEGGETSEGEILTRKILRRDDADAAFQSILKNGNPAARLYALWALRKLHGRKSDKIFADYRDHSAEVKRMSGCEVFTEKFSKAAEEIEKPFYLKMKAKDLWQMDPERRRTLLTHEEERFLLGVFRIYKSADELNKIADLDFGELFQKESERILGN
jgi:hypothetical protein